MCGSGFLVMIELTEKKIVFYTTFFLMSFA